MKFRSDPARIRGSIAPVVTPFTADGALDLASLRGLVRRQIESGSHGVSVGGSTGEPSAQTVAERIEAIRSVAAEVDDAVPFLPGTGSAKLDETLEITAAARDAGADAALVITPYYARPTQEALYTWYRTVAAEFPDLPIVIYNVPSRTAVDVAPETVARLFADCDNVVGIKETTKDFEHFSRVLHLCGRELLVWSGIELLGLPLLALGGAGFVSAVSNLAPAAVARMYEAWEAGDHETNPAPAKWVLHQQGHLASAHVRAPLLPLGDDGLPRVRALLEQGAALLGPS
ncbi:4-hydroxy-tetrahydrodipicolinate synthase [Pseudonocardia sp. Ae168_Ps1]|uniref:4-hydroxy-tetrahydrodipicolinate synthase n=1 Tax=unclassified Pseudonocardia TaxID=2619320 RepID=UPI00094B1623|nr:MULTISPECIES: 4-hydroxy-tetrahydrodipicolinate synthase [unclassified Pseudonocardia]OLL76871.1 4-hydroxy-tetrahydrodipicolinate synthase [Pseudonocardia sp. Ae150A_Ps1]OLL82885.1 4-hydroxy-tetrahydrodipicolinate synthase [Pseudonocardia sp. Ae168_Ps1]OLL83003.1 4-hydroxy-tetrahydrodipicolinate synthase [Pseudonocardia sp. Ae263_Ps1]OLL90959.1 4-hydroxy-tetrahydrodipicolinate synthase [Pseudonocardia sp. Ae356_Ps1]